LLAVVYVRVSTEDQARHGYSLEAQEEACRRKALELGAARVEVYRDEGVTGEVLERPGLQAALAAAKAGAKWFVVYDPDRLSRKLAHQLLLAEQIERAGCQLEFVTMDWQDTPEGRLFYSLRGAIAEYEKEKFKARSRFGKLAKARRGLLPHRLRIFGYRYVPGEARLEVDPAEAETYRRMVRMALEGLPPARIAEEFNASGVPGPNGDRWYRATVRRILRNPAYQGEVCVNRISWEGAKAAAASGRSYRPRRRPREEWIAVPIPPLISRGEWEALQRALDRRRPPARKNARHRYPLTGLARCGICGGPMGGTHAYSRGRVYRYYVCSRSTASNAGPESRRVPARCPGTSIRADALEEAVWNRVREWLADPEALVRDARREDAFAGIAKEKAKLERRLKDLERKHERAYEGYAQGLATREMFQKMVDEIARERVGIEQRLGEIRRMEENARMLERGAEALRELARGAAAWADELEREDREALIRALVRRVTVSDGAILLEAAVPAPEALLEKGTLTHVRDYVNSRKHY